MATWVTLITRQGNRELERIVPMQIECAESAVKVSALPILCIWYGT